MRLFLWVLLTFFLTWMQAIGWSEVIANKLGYEDDSYAGTIIFFLLCAAVLALFEVALRYLPAWMG
jgi:hypothetical protein